MACLSINRIEKYEKALVTKKQQSTSDYKFIIISFRALVLLCSEWLQNEQFWTKSYHKQIWIKWTTLHAHCEIYDYRDDNTVSVESFVMA